MLESGDFFCYCGEERRSPTLFFMIITRTPLRLAIGGGGTDLPSFYSKFGSFFISAAINKYVYVTFYRTFIEGIRLKYSRMEDVASLDEVNHPIVRETFRLHGVLTNAEMASHADIPGGTGLGSSGAFGVGLSHALFASDGKTATPADLAKEATKVQMEILQYPIGVQDQYACAFGGFRAYTVSKDGAVTSEALAMPSGALEHLEKNLCMFFTGVTRNANEILVEQKQKSEVEDSAMYEALQYTQKLGFGIRDALIAGDYKKFGELMHEHWEYKKQRSSKMSNPDIDRRYELGLKNGAVGGKVVGAGGGGFLLFYAADPEKLIAAMAAEGLRHVPFTFDNEGSKVLVNE